MSNKKHLLSVRIKDDMSIEALGLCISHLLDSYSAEEIMILLSGGDGEPGSSEHCVQLLVWLTTEGVCAHAIGRVDYGHSAPEPALFFALGWDAGLDQVRCLVMLGEPAALLGLQPRTPEQGDIRAFELALCERSDAPGSVVAEVHLINSWPVDEGFVDRVRPLIPFD